MQKTEFDTYHDKGQGPLLTERALAKRWKKSVRTLQRWRAVGYGPEYIQIGGSVRYGIKDVVAFEARQRRTGRS